MCMVNLRKVLQKDKKASSTEKFFISMRHVNDEATKVLKILMALIFLLKDLRNYY